VQKKGDLYGIIYRKGIERSKEKNKERTNKKIVIVCALVSIAAILAVIVSEYIHTNNIKKIEKLKQEYTELLDESMSNVYEDKECIKYQLSDISYHVVDIKKYDSKYIVSLAIDCSTATYLYSAERDDLARAVRDYVPGKILHDVTASTGDVLTVYNDDNSDIYHGQNMITVHVNGNLTLEPKEQKPLSSNSNDTAFWIFVTIACIIAITGGYYLLKVKIPLDMAAHNMERTKKGLDTDYVKYLSDTQFATYYNTISSDILNMQLDTNEDNLCAIFDVVKKRDLEEQQK
jgi:uncharacterized protein (UPF0335 family)